MLTMIFKLQFSLYFLVVVCATDHPRVGLRLPALDGKDVGSRIVGGNDADRGEFPHQVSLQYGSAPYMRHFCGGSILSNYWILTAGHCPLALPETRNFHVKAGKHSIKSIEKTEQISKVAKIFVHKLYPGNVAPYDIALLKLEKPFVYDEQVQPIRLPEINGTIDGQVVLSGWGSVTSSGSGMPDTLQKADLPIVDFETCRIALESILGNSVPLDISNLCTGPLSGGISACSGDSGGPLIKIQEDSTPLVVGIVSWGIIPCGYTGAPSVYTAVSSYVDWIKNIMENN